MFGGTATGFGTNADGDVTTVFIAPTLSELDTHLFFHSLSGVIVSSTGPMWGQAFHETLAGRAPPAHRWETPRTLDLVRKFILQRHILARCNVLWEVASQRLVDDVQRVLRFPRREEDVTAADVQRVFPAFTATGATAIVAATAASTSVERSPAATADAV